MTGKTLRPHQTNTNKMITLNEVIAEVIARLNGGKQLQQDQANTIASLKSQLATDDETIAANAKELADNKSQLDAYHAETDQLVAALAQFQDAPAPDTATPAADVPPAEAPPAAQ